MSDLVLNGGNFPALPAPRAIGNRWLTTLVRFFTVSEATPVDTDDQRAPRSYPKRSAYLESAAMRREMYRL